MKFTETGEIVVKVASVEVTDQKAELQFSVQDSGIGLTEEQRANSSRPSPRPTPQPPGNTAAPGWG